MKPKHTFLHCLVLLSTMYTATILAQTELASWSDSQAKNRLMEYVSTVTTKGSSFVDTEQRVAVFDNDGTLWAEQPIYFQLVFAMDRLKAMQSQHPEWKTEEPFKSALAGDVKSALSSHENLAKLIFASHAGMSQVEFKQAVKEWITTAKHPTTGRKYTEMVYQPMLEVLDYLRANGFKTYIVSGGGIDFMRVWAEEVYGIPPEQVIGSSVEKTFTFNQDGSAQITRQSELNFNNDKEGKPVAIDAHIGRRPLIAFGNSDGDLAMMQYTMAGSGKRLAVYIHHTDKEREWAYDRDSHIGSLDKGLDYATEHKDDGWIIVDMKKDWKVVFSE
ncbi:haloacid dehalogenase-like hydrolase [Thalassotalea litorea]|uniref:Haloacid dehalogenase-like hydrolase n=1 Tax=Thalassotalea litorea TaxID=2020715 RepID=A0A5R9IKP8_9GAMM|nr:HAD family hydrolase [Thalassotalea litorea]TLU64647.1 haloacid dehalogenase-like hydrolase [Thalassotalea litorea]